MNSLTSAQKARCKKQNIFIRNGVFQWKKIVAGQLFGPLSLRTDNLDLALARAAVKNNELVAGELARLKEEKKAATLQQIFAARNAIGGCTARAIYGAQRALHMVCRVGSGRLDDSEEQFTLADVTPKLLRDYQDNFCQQYEQAAEAAATAAGRLVTQKELREARLLAERTSKSTLQQAKSLFAKKRELLVRYKEKGLVIPQCVKDFVATPARGSSRSKVYAPPSDETLRQTFRDIENERERDTELYNVFWTVIAFGGRRNEALDLAVSDIIEVDGALSIGGGLGKDGETINLPFIQFAVHPDSATSPAAVVRALWGQAKAAGRELLFDGSHHYRQDVLPRRVNAWLQARGWTDQKKLHALRGYVGSILYRQDPMLARDYLRHKHLSTTEEYYTHFLRLSRVVKLTVVKPDAEPAAVTAG